MIRDMNRIEILDLDDPSQPIITCTVDEFTEADQASGWPVMGDVEIELLTRDGYVIVGGGATPVVCIRYALTGSCPECQRSNGPHYTGPCEH